jgi:hypothetical protein
MEQHFAATGRAGAGRVMMNSTAALRVSLQAGPPGEWPARVARAYRLDPAHVRPGAGLRAAARPRRGARSRIGLGRFAMRAPVTFVRAGDDVLAALAARAACPARTTGSTSTAAGSRSWSAR